MSITVFRFFRCFLVTLCACSFVFVCFYIAYLYLYYICVAAGRQQHKYIHVSKVDCRIFCDCVCIYNRSDSNGAYCNIARTLTIYKYDYTGQLRSC